jgi:hypothetical protein
MFTDMVGFTTLAQRDEALAMQLPDQQSGLIRLFLASTKTERSISSATPSSSSSPVRWGQ